MDFNFILLFIDSALLQLPDFLGGEGRMALGSDDPMVKGLILTMFAVTGFGILLNVFNSEGKIDEAAAKIIKAIGL